MEEKGDVLQAFRLYIDDENLKGSVFEWIRDKLTKLELAVDKAWRFEELKSMIAGHMRDLIQIDTQKAIELIDKWYDDSYSDQLILGELSEHPEVQFNFLQKFIHYNEDHISSHVKVAITQEERSE